MISTGCRNPLYDGAPVPTSPAPLNALSNQSIVSAAASSTKLTMPLALHISQQARRELQLRDINIAIHPVDALHLEHHVIGENISDGAR
jgi:hypothetical protein